MNQEEIKLFISIVALYEYVGTIYSREENDTIKDIEKLAEANNYTAIDTLLNKDGEFTTADEMMMEHFGEDRASMNLLADDFQYQRV